MTETAPNPDITEQDVAHAEQAESSGHPTLQSQFNEDERAALLKLMLVAPKGCNEIDQGILYPHISSD